MKRKIGLALVTGIIVLISSCDIAGTEDGDGNVTLAFQSSTSASASAFSANAEVDTGIEFTDFLLSIREVEFKTSVDDTVPDGETSPDIYFEGPYVLDLLDLAGPVAQTIGDAEIPEGEYEAVRFKLHKTTDVAVDSPLYDRSIYLAGTIDGVPFEMWHDTSENLDVGEATGVIVDGTPLELTVDFSLEAFLDQAAPGGVTIDLSTATDEDADGTIEIDPDGDDGDTNRDLADDLKDNIKLVADLIDS